MVEILSGDSIGKAICLFTGYFMKKFASSAVQIKQLLIRVDTVYLRFYRKNSKYWDMYV